jgi:hypothetical protein
MTDYKRKRASERVNVNIEVGFFCGKSFYSATATNISENGMFIRMKEYVPEELSFELLIPYKHDCLKIPVKLSRIIQEYGTFESFTVKVINPPEQYLEFVNSLRFVPAHLKSQLSG